MTEIKCPKCNGTNFVSNQKYWDDYDYMEQTYPSGEMIEKQLKRRGLSPTVPCPSCKK